eukprot:scaffold1311_cov256-Pinguiococcus_pyrenoidosus.AAC.7
MAPKCPDLPKPEEREGKKVGKPAEKARKMPKKARKSHLFFDLPPNFAVSGAGLPRAAEEAVVAHVRCVHGHVWLRSRRKPEGKRRQRGNRRAQKWKDISR